MSTDIELLAEQVRKRRLLQGSTKRDLSKHIGISISTLCKLEKGLAISRVSLSKVEYWLSEQDKSHVEEFAKERCIHTMSCSALESHLWETYAHWCQDRGIDFISRYRLQAEMRKLGYKVVKTASREPISVYFGTDIISKGKR